MNTYNGKGQKERNSIIKQSRLRSGVGGKLKTKSSKKPEEDYSYLPHIPKSKESSSITDVEKLLLQKVDYEKQTKFDKELQDMNIALLQGEVALEIGKRLARHELVALIKSKGVTVPEKERENRNFLTTEWEKVKHKDNWEKTNFWSERVEGVELAEAMEEFKTTDV